jgi:hypothetical protein
MVRQGAAAAGFVASQALSIGFGTRRGGSTQSGCIGLWSSDGVATTSDGRVRNTTLLHVLSAEITSDYTVSLDAFAAGSFTVSYSSAAAASGDTFAYMVIGGLDDAIVLNQVMDSVGATQVITGAGFQGNALLCLDASLNANNTPTSNIAVSFGCATSASRFWSVAVTETDGDTMTSAMNWNKAARTDACLERLTINGNTTDARWDLDTFDSDGFTLGVVDAPTATDQIATFLVLKGGSFEAGSKDKSAATGNDTFTLADVSLGVEGVILGCINAATGLTLNTADMMLGAGSTANTTRGSAVNNTIGIVGPEAISTTADRFSATDSVIEELTGGATPAETSEAFFDSKGTGTFDIDWVVNGGSTNPVFYLAIGNQVITPLPSVEYPTRINPALALIAASHLFFAIPTEPPAVPVPDQFPVVFPERVIRAEYPTAEQFPFATDPNPPTFVQDTQLTWYPDRLDPPPPRQYHYALDSQPERTSPLEDIEFPDRIDGRAYLAVEQQAFALGEPFVFVQDVELVWFPDSVRPSATSEQQAFALGEPFAFVQDVELAWFPDGFVRAASPQQLEEFDPQPERTSPLEDVEFPDRLDGRFFQTQEQQAFALGEPSAFVQDVELVWFPDGFVRPNATSRQQTFSMGEPSAFVQDVELVWFPDRLDPPPPRQHLAAWLDTQPERTSPLEDVEFPDRLDGRAFLTSDQQAVALGEPPVFLPLVWYPDGLVRPAPQQPLAAIEPLFVAPTPDQFPVVFPESVLRPQFGAQAQQDFAFGQPPIVPPPFVEGTPLVWFPDRFARPAFFVVQHFVGVELVQPNPPIPPVPPVPPTPPKPPKPKPKKKQRPQVSFGSSGSRIVGPCYDDFFQHFQVPNVCEIVPTPGCEIEVVQEPEFWDPPPRPQSPDARVLSYIDHVDQSHHFTENKQDSRDQRDQRSITYNFGEPDNTLRTVVLVFIGVGLAALIWYAAQASSPPAATSPRREPLPRRRSAAMGSGRED